MGKKRFKAIINGKTYILVGDYSHEHLQYATKLTQEQLEQIIRLSPNLDEQQSSVLLALNTISTQIRLEQEILKLRKRVAKLEYELLDLKHPERVLQRGMMRKTEEIASFEQLSIDEFNIGFGQKIKQVDEQYIPAILKKERDDN